MVGQNHWWRKGGRVAGNDSVRQGKLPYGLKCTDRCVKGLLTAAGDQRCFVCFALKYSMALKDKAGIGTSLAAAHFDGHIDGFVYFLVPGTGTAWPGPGAIPCRVRIW